MPWRRDSTSSCPRVGRDGEGEVDEGVGDPEATQVLEGAAGKEWFGRGGRLRHDGCGRRFGLFLRCGREVEARTPQDTLADGAEVDELDLTGGPVDGDGEHFVDVLAVADGDDQPLLHAVGTDTGPGEERPVRAVDLGPVDPAVALERFEIEAEMVGVEAELSRRARPGGRDAA
jgi:hypothetical protein